MSIFSRLFGASPETITRERFNELRAAEPRRLRFASSRKLSRGNGGPAVGFLSLAFRETIEHLLPWSLEQKDGQFRHYRRVIRSEAEYGEIESWIEQNKDTVFIRSLLTTCLAIGEHQSSPGAFTELGLLERQAKYQDNLAARVSLLDRMEAVYRRLFCELKIDAIVAVPPSSAGKFCLPAWLAAGLAARVGIEDLTPHLSWSGAKPQLKVIDVDSKWQRLEEVGLEVGTAFKGRVVLIIDDLYQSGTTVHFVASKIQQAGATDIHCLAVVKALSDTDNT